MTSAIHPALRRKGWDITADGEFYMPTRALFGRGIAGQVAEHVTALGGDAVLLVTDPGVRAAGLVAPVEAALTDAGDRRSPCSTRCSPTPGTLTAWRART